ncbi:MAG: hypothetical protein CR967_02680 [Proteobacteria bacterium]|nr:MAG: hypothetical protein CR967_02680 [Pseudomonadota bacterium]
MALPFVAGVLIGAGAVIAYNNKKELKEAVDTGFQKTKEMAEDLKKTATSTADCVKEKLKEEKDTKKSKKEDDDN